MIPLLKKGIRFISNSFKFNYRTYYCLEYDLNETNSADFNPKVDSLESRIVSSEQQVNELTSDGFDLGSSHDMLRSLLGKGAILFCIFIERVLAHAAYVAFTEETRAWLEPPYRVDYSKNEASTGGGFTIPKYRGIGLFTYNLYIMLRFLKDRRIVKARNIVHTGNIASLRAVVKFGPRVYAKGYFVRILRWRFWKEKPYKQSIPLQDIIKKTLSLI